MACSGCAKRRKKLREAAARSKAAIAAKLTGKKEDTNAKAPQK